jgi:hypothetical protein
MSGQVDTVEVLQCSGSEFLGNIIIIFTDPDPSICSLRCCELQLMITKF